MTSQIMWMSSVMASIDDRFQHWKYVDVGERSNENENFEDYKFGRELAVDIIAVVVLAICWIRLHQIISILTSSLT